MTSKVLGEFKDLILNMLDALAEASPDELRRAMASAGHNHSSYAIERQLTELMGLRKVQKVEAGRYALIDEEEEISTREPPQEVETTDIVVAEPAWEEYVNKEPITELPASALSVVWEVPPNTWSKLPGIITEEQIAEFKAHPNEWGRIKIFRKKSSAGSARARLMTGQYSKVNPKEWRFTTRKLPDGTSGLWGKYLGSSVDGQTL